MFDEKTIENLKFYVYLLIDPVTNEPFYVGKGQGNRVFDHVNQEISGETENLKYQEILRIGPTDVKHIIVRHGLNESAAFAIEASLIDTFRFIPSFEKFARGNHQGGKNSIEKGLMSTDEIMSLYNAEKLVSIDDDCIIININGTYKRGASADAIYKATKETWKMANWRSDSCKYVICEYRGLIREVYEVLKWYTKERTNKKGKLYKGYGFEGIVAAELVRSKYLNKSIADAKPRGYGYPVVYPQTFRNWVKASNAE